MCDWYMSAPWLKPRSTLSCYRMHPKNFYDALPERSFYCSLHIYILCIHIYLFSFHFQCLVFKLDNKKVVSIANEQTESQTEYINIYIYCGSEVQEGFIPTDTQNYHIYVAKSGTIRWIHHRDMVALSIPAQNVTSSWELELESSSWELEFQTSPTQRNLFEILLNQPEIRLYLPFSGWFGTKRPSVWFQFNN